MYITQKPGVGGFSFFLSFLFFFFFPFSITYIVTILVFDGRKTGLNNMTTRTFPACCDAVEMYVVIRNFGRLVTYVLYSTLWRGKGIRE